MASLVITSCTTSSSTQTNSSALKPYGTFFSTAQSSPCASITDGGTVPSGKSFFGAARSVYYACWVEMKPACLKQFAITEGHVGTYAVGTISIAVNKSSGGSAADTETASLCRRTWRFFAFAPFLSAPRMELLFFKIVDGELQAVPNLSVISIVFLPSSTWAIIAALSCNVPLLDLGRLAKQTVWLPQLTCPSSNRTHTLGTHDHVSSTQSTKCHLHVWMWLIGDYGSTCHTGVPLHVSSCCDGTQDIKVPTARLPPLFLYYNLYYISGHKTVLYSSIVEDHHYHCCHLLLSATVALLASTLWR